MILAPLLVGVAVAVLTTWAMGRPGGPGRDSWYVPFLAPGIVGYMLAGGVHGEASAETLARAWAVANGLVWAAVTAVLAPLGRLLARAARRSGGIPPAV